MFHAFFDTVESHTLRFFLFSGIEAFSIVFHNNIEYIIVLCNRDLSFRGLSISRDLFYTSAGSFGTDREVRLGLDEYFVLGDNSAASTDSRSFGPIPSGRIVGLPIAVLWPFSRARRLSGAEIDPKSRD